MKRLALLALCALLILPAAVAASAAARSKSAHGRTIHVRETTAQLAPVDNPPSGSSPGDLFAFTAALQANGKSAGSDQGYCVLVDATGGAECSVTLLLSRGQIVTVGAAKLTAAAFDLPVVGGTGAYVGASGFAHFLSLGSNLFDITVHRR